MGELLQGLNISWKMMKKDIPILRVLGRFGRRLRKEKEQLLLLEMLINIFSFLI